MTETVITLDFPSEFTDEFPLFVRALLENQTTDKKDIYEFAVQYFEDLIQERNSSGKIGTSTNEKGLQRDIPKFFQNVPVLSNFSYDNQLNSSYFANRLDSLDRRHSSPGAPVRARNIGGAQTRRCGPGPSNNLRSMMVEFSEVLTKYVAIFSEFCNRNKRDSWDSSDLDSPIHSNENATSSGMKYRSRPSRNSVYLTNVIASTKRLLQLISFGIEHSMDDELEESWEDFESLRNSIELSDDECFQQFQRVAGGINWVPDEEEPIRVITGPSFMELESLITQPDDPPACSSSGTKTSKKKQPEVPSRRKNRTSVVMFAADPSSSGHKFRSAGSREMEEEREWFFSLPSSRSSSTDESDENSDVMSSNDSLVKVNQTTQRLSVQKTREESSSSDGHGIKTLQAGGLFDFLRAYFTLRKIRQVEDLGDTDDPFVDYSDIGSPVLMKCCDHQRVQDVHLGGIADAIRSWFFIRRINQWEDSLVEPSVCHLEEELNMIRKRGFEKDDGPVDDSFEIENPLSNSHVKERDYSELFAPRELDFDMKDPWEDITS